MRSRGAGWVECYQRCSAIRSDTTQHLERGKLSCENRPSCTDSENVPTVLDARQLPTSECSPASNPHFCRGGLMFNLLNAVNAVGTSRITQRTILTMAWQSQDEGTRVSRGCGPKRVDRGIPKHLCVEQAGSHAAAGHNSNVLARDTMEQAQAVSRFSTQWNPPPSSSGQSHRTEPPNPTG